jgi:endonuclease/exonuclease/phosphatase family metal-dependent hydrolase
MNRKSISTWHTTERRCSVLIALLVIFTTSAITIHSQQVVSNTPLLTYAELVELYETPIPAAGLESKLAKLLATPIVNNLTAPAPLRSGGKFIRVASWNIERGLEFEAVKAAFTRDQRFFQRLPTAQRSSRFDLPTILKQSDELRRADVVVLNEVDWGLRRTDYRNVGRELATAMQMNYAYAVEFVEVDPLTLGTETLDDEADADKAEMLENIAVDRTRTLGLHGTAILSRYPLRNVRIVRFVNQAHDWYADEKKGISVLEKGKQKTAEAIFSEKIRREVRRGGRMMLLADIEDPGIPGGVATVVATHLEAKAKPGERVKQLQELLAAVKGINHPVILAGDMNTSGSDSTPTSFQREFKKRMGSKSFWVTKGIKYATGVGLVYDVTLGLVKFWRTRSDPTVKNVKFVSENPEEKFFTTLKDFRFDDGGAFDFRGARQYSIGAHNNTLSDSNERASKGFVSTLELKSKIDIELKLDWIFVKPADLTDPDDTKQPFRFAPQFGRTLKALNYSLKDRISDHSPILVDLPLK